jgi:hypothetical protein
MATITLTFSATGLNLPLTKNLPDADMARLVAALKTYYPPVLDGQGVPIPWTNAAVLTVYAQGLMTGLQGMVQSVEQQALNVKPANVATPIALT